MNGVSNEAIRDAISDCLSGAQVLPSVRTAVLNEIKGEHKIMKKKFSAGVVFAMLMTILMASAALAAGLGLFGQLGESGEGDARLSGLERVAESVGATFTTADGVTITVDQAYYDGSRVFISYTKSGPFDVVTMGEGVPEGLGECDWPRPGEKFGESFGFHSPSFQQIAAHMNAGGARWARRAYVNVHDGLRSGETDLEIIGGDTYLTADGTMIGWKECVVPEEIAADELTVSLGVFASSTTYCQDETGLYEYYGDRAPATWYAFTVKKDATAGAQLTGAGSGKGWTAEARLTASPFDLKGEIVLRCPQDWVEIERTWENPQGIDHIREWKLSVNGVLVDGWIIEGTDPRVDGQLTYQVLCRMDGAAQDLALVPVYSESGACADEAIRLTPVE